jgi:hypothetical protein
MVPSAVRIANGPQVLSFFSGRDNIKNGGPHFLSNDGASIPGINADKLNVYRCSVCTTVIDQHDSGCCPSFSGLIESESAARE